MLKFVALIVIIIALVFVGKQVYSRFTQNPSTQITEDRPEFTDDEYDRYYELKQAALERVLGPMHDMVGHAIIPFGIGGTIDMYYFPNGIDGTGFATMELIEPDGSGPKPNKIGTYELVSFTKHNIAQNSGVLKAEGSPYNQIERRMCGIMTTVAYYSYEAVLNPSETAEVPFEENKPNVCLIFDEYKPSGKEFEIDGQRHCLLLCMEIFKSEMEYAMKHGSAGLLKALKEKGYYPYSDLDRKPVF